MLEFSLLRLSCWLLRVVGSNNLLLSSLLTFFFGVLNLLLLFLQVSSEYVVVHDSEGREVVSQILPLVNASAAIRNQYVKAYLGISPKVNSLHWLAFPVSIPPLGFNTYVVSSSKRTGEGSITCFWCNYYLCYTNSLANFIMFFFKLYIRI